MTVEDKKILAAKFDKAWSLLADTQPTMLASAHKIHTPRPLVTELVEYASIATVGPVDVLVVSNVEFIFGLKEAERAGDISINSITFVSDDPVKTAFATKAGCAVVSNISNDMKGKFDLVLQNPAYKNGLFRKFMKLGLDCLAPEGVMIQVSPDERGTINRKNETTLKLMRTNGLVEVLDSDKHFNVGTVTPIVTYIFNKGEATNTKLLEVEMTAEEALTDSIIKKIAAKKEELGSLTAKTMGTPPRKGDKSEVDMLKAVSATGATYDTAPADTVRFFDNADGVYFLNPFFNISSSTVVTATGPLYIHKDNIHTLSSDVAYTAEEFARLFTSDAIKFMMSFYRGSYWRNKGWILNEIPQIPTDVTDVNAYFGFTAEEVAHIESSLTK